MKRFLTVAIAFLCVATSAFSQTLTAADRERGMQYLESTRQAVLDATAGLSEAQWNFKPGPDQWSVAEVVEHIAAAEDFLMAMVTNQVMKGPARPAGDDVKAIDDMVVAKIPDRSKKAQAPEPHQAHQSLRLSASVAQAFHRCSRADRNFPEDAR